MIPDIFPLDPLQLLADYGPWAVLLWWAFGLLLVKYALTWTPARAFLGRQGVVWAVYRFIFGYVWAPLVTPPALLILGTIGAWYRSKGGKNG